jgi:chromate reductase, NAD(P)H dehydrogenase (quinone)
MAKLAPDSLKLEIVTLHELGFFNQDLEANPPAEWLAFRDRIKASDGVVFVTPEYNRSIPGVLKNAVDIASPPMRGVHSTGGQPGLSPVRQACWGASARPNTCNRFCRGSAARSCSNRKPI